MPSFARVGKIRVVIKTAQAFDGIPKPVKSVGVVGDGRPLYVGGALRAD